MDYPLLRFKENIIKSVEQILEVEEVPLEIPDEERGDYALPCFTYASELKRSPQDIAEEIANDIHLEDGTAEQMGPYVNFKMDDGFLVTSTIEQAEEMGEDFGKMEAKDEKVIVEHTSANPNGPLHVGNARNPIIGDTMARIYEKIGYDVETQYYVDDMGRQVATLASGISHYDEERGKIIYENDEFDYGPGAQTKIDHKLGEIYRIVSKNHDDSEDIRTDIQNKIREVEKDPERFQEYSDKIMRGIVKTLADLNVEDAKNNTLVQKKESEFVKTGEVEEILDELENKPECGGEDGAFFIRVGKKNVFLRRSDGTSLYPARDIAYHRWKSQNADILIDILGEDHKLHGRSIEKAMRLLDIEPLPYFIFYSFVTFEGKKMSTRAGTSVTLDDFMSKAKEKAKDEINKRRKELTPELVDEIAEKVGIGAVRFNIIKVQPEKPIDFRWEEALNFQGDSAPFVQYSYARACGILEKYEREQGQEDENKDISRLNEYGEIALIKQMAKYPRVLKHTADNNAPHRLAKYALRLAAEFNQFYRDHPVLKSEDKRIERVSLVRAFTSVMKSVLNTLGLEAPEQM